MSSSTKRLKQPNDMPSNNSDQATNDSDQNPMAFEDQSLLLSGCDVDQLTNNETEYADHRLTNNHSDATSNTNCLTITSRSDQNNSETQRCEIGSSASGLCDMNAIDTSLNNKRMKAELRIPLNVIVTDTGGENDCKKLINKTKKFYESDDASINTIFSQTITSTTVTPTDEDYSYTYDSPSDYDCNDKTDNCTQQIEHENAQIDDHLTVIERQQLQQSEHSSAQDSQTETLDIYNEPEQLISLVDKIRIDDRTDNDQLISDTTELSPFDRETSGDFFCDDLNNDYDDHVYDHDGHDNKIGMNDADQLVELCCSTDQTILRTSYFDQTIEENFDENHSNCDDEQFHEDSSSDHQNHSDQMQSLSTIKTSTKIEKKAKEDCDTTSIGETLSSSSASSALIASSTTTTTTKITKSAVNVAETTATSTTTTATAMAVDSQDEVIVQKTEKKKKSESSSGKKKSKKSKKSDAEKENNVVKSSFSKFEALQNKNILHVRSSDAGRAQEKFNGQPAEVEKKCKACDKQVYKMEEMKAEKCIWHKQCFKCSECSKQLNIDTYESHESILYCKPHFKALFTPKAVENNEIVAPRKPELIILENQPVELPPDVVRSSDKADLGLEELQQLNVRARYQVFENTETSTAPERLNHSGLVKRSPSILSKLAKFQAKGIDVGLNNDSLAGLNESSSDEDDELVDENDEDADLIRAKNIHRERPLSFANMNDIKSRFESGHAITKEERREERKQEIQNIRSRLFLGKQAKIKEMYQQAVLESEQGVRAVDRKPDMEIGDKARHIKDLFEKGEIFKEVDGDTEFKTSENERAVFEQGIGKKSRTLFMEMDANAAKTPPTASTPVTPTPKTPSPLNPKQYNQPSIEEIVRYDEKVDEVKIETAEITNKFKFFETYKPTENVKKTFRITPPRDGVVKLPSPERQDIYIDTDIIRSNGKIEDSTIAEESHTTTKMLYKFRELEEKKDDVKHFDGYKPLKRFTPPPNDERRLNSDESENDCTNSEDDDDDDDDDDEDDDDNEDAARIHQDNSGENDENQNENGEKHGNYVRSSDKDVDEYLMQSKSNAIRAKQLRAKFERWESKEMMKEQDKSVLMLYDGNEQSQVESAKEIRAKFESMRDTQNQMDNRERIKVNRFV